MRRSPPLPLRSSGGLAAGDLRRVHSALLPTSDSTTAHRRPRPPRSTTSGRRLSRQARDRATARRWGRAWSPPASPREQTRSGRAPVRESPRPPGEGRAGAARRGRGDHAHVPALGREAGEGAVVDGGCDKNIDQWAVHDLLRQRLGDGTAQCEDSAKAETGSPSSARACAVPRSSDTATRRDSCASRSPPPPGRGRSREPVRAGELVD